MAITAIDAVIADVMLMTELNWLLALDISARVPTRAGDFRRYPQRGEQNKNCAEDRRAREIVCAVTKNLWHRRRRNLVNRRTRTLNANRRGPRPQRYSPKLLNYFSGAITLAT